LRSYETMTATARRQPEGSLVYIIDQTDLYLRVREGVRQVQVIFFILYFCLYRNRKSARMTQIYFINTDFCVLMQFSALFFSLGATSPYQVWM